MDASTGSPLSIDPSDLADLPPARAGATPPAQSGSSARPAPDLGAQITPGPTGQPNAGDPHVCPYCGLAGPRSDGPCSRCTIEDTPATRQATKARIGPWYVLQNRNPAAPGMKWSTLMMLVKKGQVTPRSIVRGPTTHQLWRLASQVKGLSREFGVCYSCGGTVDRLSNQCPHCDRLQEPPANPDALLEAREAPRRPGEAVGGPGATLPVKREASAVAGGNEIVPAGRESRPDAGLLTARELAAAFQLDFQPESAEPPRRTAAPARPTNGATAPARAPAAPEPAPAVVDPPLPRRSIRRVLAVLLVLGLAGADAVTWLHPPYREAVTVWATDAWAQARDAWARLTAPAPEAPRLPAGPATNQPISPAPEGNGRAEAPSMPRDGNAAPPSEPRSTDPAPGPSAPASGGPVLVIPSDPETIRQLARSLRAAAIDAESLGDYHGAVRQYEQIRQLPREYWPSDLDLRLDRARANIR